MRKSGIDYFPLDVALDEKFDLIEAEFGLTGFGVVVKLLQRIYGGQGYYVEWTEEVALLFARRVGLGGSVVSEIVTAAVKRGVFHKEIFDKYQVLTSRGVQSRYFEAVARRKEIEVDERILLVDVTQICKNANIKRRNVDILGGNADISAQSRVEERRVEESRAEYMPSAAADTENVIALFAQNTASQHRTPLALSSINQWCEQAGPELVRAVILDVAKGGKKPWAYMEKRLIEWYELGLRTQADVDAHLAERERVRSAASGRSNPALSYPQRPANDAEEGVEWL